MDAVSRAIGQVEESIKGLGRSLDRDRDENAERHTANVKKLGDIEKRLSNLEVTRWKFVGGMTVASAILMGVGWLVLNALPKIADLVQRIGR